MWIVPKKPDANGNKRWRMVIDLNGKTVPDAYPLPNISEILDQLGSNSALLTWKAAFTKSQCIPMTPKRQHSLLPLDTTNLKATLPPHSSVCLQGSEMFVYLDDIVIYASSLHEHEIKFKKMANRFRAANLSLKPSKCNFLRKEIAYLANIITE